jgi:hypothetical protein
MISAKVGGFPEVFVRIRIYVSCVETAMVIPRMQK